MKILLTGASGLLGRAVYREFAEGRDGFEITGTAFSRTGGEFIKLDLLDSKAVRNTIAGGKWDLIIHSAAERRPDVVKEDVESAEKLNVEAVRTIAEAAEEAGAAVLYMSTDYVFDGTNPPYYPDSVPNPLNHYGRMKLGGERQVQTACGRSVILRVPILYGEEQTLTESAVLSIAAGIKADSESFHDNEAVRYPTHVNDVAAVIGGLAELIDRERSGGAGDFPGGIYHWSSGSPYTKYEMALVMAGIMGVDKSFIRKADPDPNAAPRPKNSHLDTGRLKALGIGRESDFTESVREALTRLACI